MRFRSANRFDPAEIERRQDPEKEMRGDLLFFTILLIVAILWIYVIPNYVYLSLPVLGHSMEPTFRNSGDTVGVLRLTGYAYGDIVIAYSNDGTLVIKRVLALGGDTITQVDEHTVRIEQEDGEVIVLQNEPYIYGQNDSANNGKTWHLEEDEVFLAGDHREVSQDSFDYGPIGRSQLVGRVILLFRDGGISRVFNTWADLFTALPSSESPDLTPMPAPGSETLSGLSAAA